MITIQNLSHQLNCPNNAWFVQTVEKIISLLNIDKDKKQADLLIRLSCQAEVAQLNKQYRNQDKTTNILSFIGNDLSDFPLELQKELPQSLGELVICFETVIQEAKTQNKTLNNHLTHLLIHGILHLLGYDHQQNDEAQIMEDVEDRILLAFNITLTRLD